MKGEEVTLKWSLMLPMALRVSIDHVKGRERLMRVKGEEVTLKWSFASW